MLMLLIRLCAILILSTFGVHSNIKNTSGGTRSQKVWEPLI